MRSAEAVAEWEVVLVLAEDAFQKAVYGRAGGGNKYK